MPNESHEPQVIIPYSQLCDLLEAAVELKKLRVAVKKLTENQAALRYQFIELMEKFRELE